MEFTTRLLNLIGLQRRSSNLGGGSGVVSAAPVLSGTYISPQSSLGLTAVYCAVNVISRDLASLPWRIYKKRPDGGRDIVEDHPVYEILSVSPDGTADSFSLKQTVVGHTLGWGNGLCRIDRSPRDGRPEALHLLHPSKTKPMLDESTGNLYYELNNDKNNRLSPENVLHFSGLGFNGIQGYSPVYMARQSLGVAMAAEQAGGALFGNGMLAKGILKLKKKLSPTGINNLRNSLSQSHQGVANAFNLLILEEDMDWVNAQINPEDASWIESRQFGVIEVARIFSIPPHKLGDYSQSHLANIEASNLDYIATTLMGWICTIEAQLNFKLLSALDRKQYVIACDMSALQRGDSAARVTYYTGMRNMGVLSADEIRVKEGMNPLGSALGGDKHLVQMQMQPLDQAGTLPASPPKTPAKQEPPEMEPPEVVQKKSHETAKKYGSLLRSHRNPVSVLSEDFLAADSNWRDFSMEQLLELQRSHSQEAQERLLERRELLREYSVALREERVRYDKEQRQETREYLAAQAEALTTFEKEENPSEATHERFRAQQALDLQDFIQSQASERLAYCEEQQYEYQAMVKDLDGERARILKQQGDERQVLIEDLVLELLERSQEFPGISQRLQPTFSSNGFSNGH